MTPTELRAIRKRVAPDLTQAQWAAALDYDDARSYRRYESIRGRPVPPLLAKLAEMLDRHGMPEEWRPSG